MKKQLGRKYFFLIQRINTGGDILFSGITRRRKGKKKKIVLECLRLNT